MPGAVESATARERAAHEDVKKVLIRQGCC
jgi:hypothetical protein